jgi:hypothetical protein
VASKKLSTRCNAMRNTGTLPVPTIASYISATAAKPRFVTDISAERWRNSFGVGTADTGKLR